MRKLTLLSSALLLSIPVYDAAAFDTTYHSVGLVYAEVPFGPTTSKLAGPAFGLRYGQFEYSSDPIGAGVKGFMSRPAVVDLKFNQKGLQKLHLNGMNTLDWTTRFNAFGVAETVAAVSWAKVAMGAAAVAAAAAASGGGSSSGSTSSTSGSTSGTSTGTGTGTGTTSKNCSASKVKKARSADDCGEVENEKDDDCKRVRSANECGKPEETHTEDDKDDSTKKS